MREKKAKRIRKEVYGDMADVRKYRQVIKTGQVICAGLRQVYQRAKKAPS